MSSARSLLLLLVLTISLKVSTAIPSSFNLDTSLPFSRHLNLTGYANIAEADRARAKAMKSHGSALGAHDKRAASIPASNIAVTYIANVGIGNPPTNYSLLIDSGSSSTWVGAGKAYVKTSMSVNTAKNVSVTYGSGQYSGTEYLDQVTLSSSLVIQNQSIGVASSSSGFANYDGVLGIGPVVLTQNIVSDTPTVPTVMDNLYHQATIATEAIGVFYAPILASTSGELTFGGADSSKYTGSIAYTPLTSTLPAAHYWGVNQSVTYGTTNILSSTSGIIDTGTTLILLATDAYDAYVNATGAVLDAATGMLKITSAQYSTLTNLNFTVGGTTYILSPNAQIWPRLLNAYIGGTSGSIYLVVNDLGSKSGQGLDFINGYTFLERHYSVFDTTNNRLGLATTAYTNATVN